MAHDAADRERLLRFADEPDQLPRRPSCSRRSSIPNADPAVNYGSIGAVIGHEIGHGFDDQGREFDGAGKVRNWWTPETNAKFVEKTRRSSKARTRAFCPLEGACVNGQLTMGENIGDLGGAGDGVSPPTNCRSAGKEAPVVDGFTGDQRFFLVLRAGVARQDPRRRRSGAQCSPIRTRPRPARGSSPRAQHRRLVHGVWRQGRRQTLSQAGRIA